MPDERLWIKDLRPGLEVSETYVVRSKEIRQRRNGGPFLALSLGDRTGQVNALAWQHAQGFARMAEIGRVLQVHGQVQQYNGRLQLVVAKIDPVNMDEVDDELYIRSSRIDPDILWNRLLALIEEVGDKHLRQLLYRVFQDEEIATVFRVAPAARSMHHAFRSGLLEHTVSVTHSARALARHYELDESLVVAGALLHDLGKIWELEIGPSIEYTDDGRLLGHLPLELLYVERRLAELPSFPGETRRQLLHILLSHHGEYAYGSPRRPKTPEALLVHQVDTLDAQMAGMFEAIAQDGDSEQAWSAFSRILERNVYRRRAPSAAPPKPNDKEHS